MQNVTNDETLDHIRLFLFINFALMFWNVIQNKNTNNNNNNNINHNNKEHPNKLISFSISGLLFLLYFLKDN